MSCGSLPKTGLYPGFRLQQVRHHIALREHGTLGHPRRAAGVLQEGNVTLRERHLRAAFVTPLFRTLAQRQWQTLRHRQRPGRHHFPDMRDHKVGHAAFDCPQQITQLRGQHMFHWRIGNHFLQNMGKIFQDDNDFRAGILELMRQLRRRIHRVAIDHGATRAQRAKQAHRILQAVGHHQHQARTFLQAENNLQVGGKVARQAVKLRIADACAHAHEGSALPILSARIHPVHRSVMHRR